MWSRSLRLYPIAVARPPGGGGGGGGTGPFLLGSSSSFGVSSSSPPPSRYYGGTARLWRQVQQRGGAVPNGAGGAAAANAASTSSIPRGGGILPQRAETVSARSFESSEPAAFVIDDSDHHDSDDDSEAAVAEKNSAAAAATIDSADLRSLLARIDSLEARINDLSRISQPSFRAGQYNILASYLGSNTEPWFLYGGLTDSPEDLARAEAVGKKHRQRDSEGNLVNVGWPNYAEGILTPDEMAEVERRHDNHFAWDVRAPKILQRIKEMDADVLSLVELDRYDTFFKPALHDMGYDSLWTKRPRPSSVDGCAVCWRKSKFELIASKSFEYTDDVQHADENGSGAGGHRRDRVALLTLLRMKHAPDPHSARLIFVSTHLARNPECRRQEAVRLRQAAQLMMELKTFADAHGCGPDVPAVVAGDWNAESLNEIRSVTSAVFGLQGSILGGGGDGDNNDGDDSTNSAAVPHPLLWGNTDVPTRPTSYTLLRRSRIDYLMYSETYLRLRRVSRLDDDDARDARTGRELPRTIPNERHPSDHLPIAADFMYPTELEVAQECARRFCAGLLAAAYANDKGGGAAAATSSTYSMVRPLSPVEMRAAFEYFDHNGSGVLTAEELDAGVVRLGEMLTSLAGVGDGGEGRRRIRELCCTEILSEEEDATDGAVAPATTAASSDAEEEEVPRVATLDSFRRAFEQNFLSARHRLMSDESSPFMKDVVNAFRYFDLDGNGVLDHAEIETTLKSISPVPVDGAAVRRIIEAIDENGDGEVQLEEFVAAMLRGYRGEQNDDGGSTTGGGSGGGDGAEREEEEER